MKSFTLSKRYRDGVRNWEPTRFRRDGFCLFADYGIQSEASGVVHTQSHHDFEMTACGQNTSSKPIAIRLVRRWVRIGCLRCLTVLMLRLHREGLLVKP